MAGVSAIFSLVSCNTPVYSCASVQAPIFLPYNLPVISFKVCSKFISNSILHDSFIFAKMNVPCHTHFFIFFFFVWVLYLFLVSHPLVSAVPWVFPILFGLHTLPAAAPGYFLHFSASIPFFPRPGYFLSFSASIPFFPLRLGYFLSFSASIPFFPLRPGIFCTFRPLYPFSRCALGISCTFRLFIPSQY